MCCACLYVCACTLLNAANVTLQCPADRTLQNGADCNNGLVKRCLCLKCSPQKLCIVGI